MFETFHSPLFLNYNTKVFSIPGLILGVIHWLETTVGPTIGWVVSKSTNPR